MCNSINSFIGKELNSRLQAISNMLGDIEDLVFEENYNLVISNKDDLKGISNRINNILNVDIKEDIRK